MSRDRDAGAQLEKAAAAFHERYGRPPRFAAAAPGRVNLIGEHVDYNDGYVLPMAIERQTLIVADRAAGNARRVRVASMDEQGVAEFEAAPGLGPGQPAWANYVRGVVAGYLDRSIDPGGFDALVASTVPVGSGLSSSAAIEVSTATLVEALAGKSLEPLDMALLCQWAEHNFAGVPCGIMDQAISVMGQRGHAMLLDCRSLTTRMVPLADDAVTVLIANTNVKHELSEGEYGKRRAECEAAARVLGVKSLRDATLEQVEAARDRLDAVTLRRARHVVTEIARVTQAADAAEERDWPTFGRLMSDSHASLRDDFEVSCDELDAMVEVARELTPQGQVIGSRMTGGGFGGCTVSLVRTGDVEAVTRHLAEGYRERTGIEPTIFATRPGQGARRLRVGAVG